MDLIDRGFVALSDRTGLRVDQVRYLILLLSTYPLSLVFRHLLHPSRLSPTARHLFALFFGISFGLICFGTLEMSYLILVVAVSYVLLWLVSPSQVQIYTMVWAFGCILAAHIYRFINDPGGYHLDFTGPLMLIVQRLTLVGFALHDGMARKEQELNDDQEAQKIVVQPSPLEYASYVFGVFGFLAGPTCTIKEYVSFVDGSNLKPLNNLNSKEPSSLYPVLSKLSVAIVCAIVHLSLTAIISHRAPLDPSISFPRLLLLCAVMTVGIRCRLYFVWLITESTCNVAGLGFSGWDQLGRPQWDLLINVDIMATELAPNVRSLFINFNRLSGAWLRRVWYERTSFSPNLSTWFLSALWHGVYPGYYLALLCCGLYNEAARKLRRLLRHHFQGSPSLKWGYDISSTLLTMFSMPFAMFPFIYLSLEDSLLFWSQWYFIPLIVVTSIILFLPGKVSRNEAQQDNKRTIKRE